MFFVFFVRVYFLTRYNNYRIYYPYVWSICKYKFIYKIQFTDKFTLIYIRQFIILIDFYKLLVTLIKAKLTLPNIVSIQYV